MMQEKYTREELINILSKIGYIRPKNTIDNWIRRYSISETVQNNSITYDKAEIDAILKRTKRSGRKPGVSITTKTRAKRQPETSLDPRETSSSILSSLPEYTKSILIKIAKKKEMTVNALIIKMITDQVDDAIQESISNMI